MVSIRFASAFAAAALVLGVAAQDASATPTPTIKNPITTPTVTLPASQIVDIGCFETGIPLENHGPYLYRSPGNCQLVCLEQKKNVMGLSDGENCWCGDLIPAAEWQTKNESCDTSCSGEKNYDCGGPGLLWIALTGNTRNRVENFKPESSSSSSKPSATAPSTSKPSATNAPANDGNTGSKPNTAAIAAGVVVGIVGLAAIVFGIWFFLRRRRQRQAEEDYRRNAANVSSFVNGGKLHTSNSSMNDSRLDPSFTDRRQSNGSIADNEDYSRRILKVTNA
ncbi:hypothetical protein IQ07DRAFT_584002 [Pyrenochaeta sp. DS3sAY3a]|nr:hypothetical protein IQ07DRAFT_584002 [Pyrenochaeta sp. DS3sAY3a]